MLAPAFLAVVLTDARPAAFLARTSLADLLADARPPALLALASLEVVCEPPLASAPASTTVSVEISPRFLQRQGLGRPAVRVLVARGA